MSKYGVISGLYFPVFGLHNSAFDDEPKLLSIPTRFESLAIPLFLASFEYENLKKLTTSFSQLVRKEFQID